MGGRNAGSRLLGWLAFLAAAAPVGSAPVVSGRATVAFEAGDTLAWPEYSNSGFHQAREGETVAVEVTASGDFTRAPFHPHAARPQEGEVAAFARRATAGARLQAEAVTALLHAISGRIRYRRGPDLPVQPLDVLRHREASCVGLSELAIAALASLGIEARPARGVLVDEGTGDVQPHRWIEVRYPDAGWVFSDPTESINYVSPLHVVTTPPADPDPCYDPSLVARQRLRLSSRNDRLYLVDVRPGRPSGLAERRLYPVQWAAAVVGRLRPAGAGTVRLIGNDEVRVTAVRDGAGFSFPGLSPGRYVLEGESGSHRASVTVSLAESQLLEMEVSVP